MFNLSHSSKSKESVQIFRCEGCSPPSPGLRYSCSVSVLSLFWPSPEPVLAQFWLCSAHVMVHLWPSSEPAVTLFSAQQGTEEQANRETSFETLDMVQSGMKT